MSTFSKGDVVTWETSAGSFTGTVKAVHADGLITVICEGTMFLVSPQRLGIVKKATS